MILLVVNAGILASSNVPLVILDVANAGIKPSANVPLNPFVKVDIVDAVVISFEALTTNAREAVILLTDAPNCIFCADVSPTFNIESVN